MSTRAEYEINSHTLADEVGTHHDQGPPRFGFAAQAKFNNFQKELESVSNFTHEMYVGQHNEERNRVPQPNTEDPAYFHTYFRQSTVIDMKMQAARESPQLKQPYAPPSEYEFRSRDESREVDEEFTTNLHLPNNQQLRIGAARAQGGFHQDVVPKDFSVHNYDPKKDGKPDFVTHVPSSCNPAGVINARIKATRDQHGLWDGGKTIKEHEFREETTGKYGPFRTHFKPK